MADDQPTNWRNPPSGLALRQDEVHVWLVNQDEPLIPLAELRNTLAEDERKRAERFHFERDRRRFIVARGILRALLGHYLEAGAAQIEFSYSAYDKPGLAGSFAQSGLRFNISHSQGMALLAFTMGRELGVDIEQIRPDFATGDIAGRFFSASEIAALDSLPPGTRAEAFFNCWTRKEAYIKAIGEGLSCPLDKFDVTLRPGEPAELLATRVQSEQASRWRMSALTPGGDFKAALIVEGDGWVLRCWKWPDAARL
ncbi:MAG TPA: 4'-phosphopantetheinyl transferase superfamily protein [Blastocatellia bacterium]|nr:4'-phosphopantetheinyl transferase superfamily protein [Blastocatellia bacterium]